jgi:Family of unknown function (DUF6516)
MSIYWSRDVGGIGGSVVKHGLAGRRLVGYDNERGKGDHRHIEGREEPYRFRGWEALIDDFLGDVARIRSKL